MDAIPVSDTKAARRRTGRLTKDERAMRRMEREAEEKLTAALQSLGKRVMANLSDVQTEALPAVILARIDDPNTWLPFRDVLIEFLKDAALAGADLGRRQVEQGVFGVRKAVSASFNVDWDLANTSAAQWAQQHGAMLVSGLAGTTRDRVASEVRYFVENGLPLSELRKRIMNIETGAFSGARAQTIAVTETTRAFAEGNVAAWQQSGVIMAYEWDTANDEITCPICGRLKGMRVPMGQGFGRYGRPPAHPNCRCGLLPVVEVPELADVEQYVQWAEAGQPSQAITSAIMTPAEQARKSILDLRTGFEDQIDALDSAISQYEEQYRQLQEKWQRLPRAEQTAAELADYDETTRLFKLMADSRTERIRLEREMATMHRSLLYVDRPLQMKVRGNAGLVTSERIEEVFRLIPDSVAANNKDLQIVRDTGSRSGGRAFMANGNIHMTAQGKGPQVFAHELGHILEYHDESMLKRSLDFVERRTRGESYQPLRDVTEKTYDSDEKTKPDQFINPYIGKDYGGRASEVLSMGLEYLYTNPAKLAREDPDMFDFIYNTLRGR